MPCESGKGPLIIVSIPHPPDPHAPHNDLPGRILARETAEQPTVLRRILSWGAPVIRMVVQEVTARARAGSGAPGGPSD